MATGMVISVFLSRVEAIMIPNVPFWIPDSMEMVILCFFGNKKAFAKKKPVANVNMFNSKVSGPIKTKYSTKTSLSFNMAPKIITVKKTAEAILTGLSAFKAIIGNFFFKNMPTDTGTKVTPAICIMVCNTGKVILPSSPN